MLGRPDNSLCGRAVAAAGCRCGLRNMDRSGSEYAVKPMRRPNASVQRSASDPSDEHESAFFRNVQLIIVPISDIMSTWLLHIAPDESSPFLLACHRSSRRPTGHVTPHHIGPILMMVMVGGVEHVSTYRHDVAADSISAACGHSLSHASRNIGPSRTSDLRKPPAAPNCAS